MYRSRGSHILPWVDRVGDLLAAALATLTNREETDLCHSAVQELVRWLARTRLVETGPRLTPWGATRHLDTITLDWYVPGEAELNGVTTLLKRFFFPVLETLSKFASGDVELDKETLQRHLKLVRRIFIAVSELSGPEVTETCSSVLSSVMGWMDKLHIRPEGESVRMTVCSLVMDIQRKLVQERSDDVESFTEILAIYEAALFCHGRDEEEVSDHVEEHKRGKADQRDQLVRGKHHLAR